MFMVLVAVIFWILVIVMYPKFRMIVNGIGWLQFSYLAGFIIVCLITFEFTRDVFIIL